MKLRRGLLAALAVLVALVAAQSAQAVTPGKVFVEGVGGTEGVACQVLAAKGNIRECNGQTHTWDGTRIDTNVFLPPEAQGPGPYPTIGVFHGWGESKLGLNTVPIGSKTIGTNTFVATSELTDPRIQGWAEKGYAVFSMSDRGWGRSCGAFDTYREAEAKEIKEEEEAKIAPGARAKTDCARGYNHLMDDRYEVRDAQFLLSRLADEGLVQPKKIGVTGASYGGGISIALAALRNRTMVQETPGTGTLVPWESPEGRSMEIAAAAPQWPWTDLSYSLAPNGRNLDYVTNSPYRGPSGKLPIGVWKASWSLGLYVAGVAISNYNPKDPQANIPGWIQRFEAGDPYSDASIEAIVKQLSTFHSSFGIDSSVEPSPLLIQSGWNDDLFPVDEALRYYQRTRAQYPDDPISLYLADIGHSRSQNKTADVAAFNVRLEAWFAHYLKGEGADPSPSVEALTTTCPKAAPSESLQAADWADLQPGEISLQSSGSQTITHGTNGEEGTATKSSKAFDPIEGTKTPCTALPVAEVENPHAVTYSLGAAPSAGYTLMGSPTIIADVESPSPNSEIAARLLDVSPEGTENLVARGLYRPTGGDQEMVFQLHPQAYHFAAGHVAKLELLPSDFPYGRFSNLQNNVTVSDLELRLPVTDAPGSLGGLVQTPAPKVVPAGYTLAEEFKTNSSGGGSGESGGGTSPSPKPSPSPAPVKIGAGGFAGKFSANRKAVIVPVRCSGEGACSGQVSISVKKPGGKGRTVLAKGAYSVGQGATAQVRLPLTKAGRNIVKSLATKGSHSIAGVVNLIDSGRPSLVLKRPVQLMGGK
jgi:fermentation-respiration switch protein FrsA (DUF1100 family)